MPKSKPLVWSLRAEKDLDEIWDYYVRVASPEIADRLLRDIDYAARRVEGNPLGWRSRNEVKPGLRSILVSPYTIFYRIRSRDTQIVRVLHERRDFPALFSRE